MSSLTISWVDKATTGTWSFESVDINVGTRFAAIPATQKQFSDHFNSGLFSQLINKISRVLQKLLR